MTDPNDYVADEIGKPGGLATPIGYATATRPGIDQSYFPWDLSELNPILSWPGSVQIYSMMRIDSQVAATTRALHSTVLKIDWRIDPAGAPDELVNEFSTATGLPIMGTETSSTPNPTAVPFYTHLEEALEVTTYGHMPFEVVVDIRNGRAVLSDLQARHPRSLTRINTDSQGRISDIWQAANSVPIPGSRLLWYKTGGIGAVPQGVSMLRAAYRPYKSRDELERINMISAARNGMGIPVAEMNNEATQAEVQAAAELASAVRASDFAGIAMKNGTMRFRGVEGSTHNILDDIRYQNSQISKAMLEMFLDLGTASTGSHALGQVQIDLFRDHTQAFANSLAEQFTNQVFKRLAIWNYGPNVKVPRLVAGPVGEELPPQMLAILAQAGLITPDRGTEVHLRQQYKLPEMDPGTVPGSGLQGESIKVVHAPPVHEDDPGAANF